MTVVVDTQAEPSSSSINRNLTTVFRYRVTPNGTLASAGVRNELSAATRCLNLTATSKNYFLRIWVEDFGSEKVMEKTAYFVYGGFFISHFWGKRFVQIPKGEFLEVPYNWSDTKRRAHFRAPGWDQ